ncbi:MAG: site-specific DNA-methyltransferase [Anaerolineaceae bacterium]|nr:site-specific DNA-methyltransferase [Anaerolineaceae bacterium]
MKSASFAGADPNMQARVLDNRFAIPASSLDDFLPDAWREITDLNRALPKLAKDHDKIAKIESLLHKIPTRHDLVLGDARSRKLSPRSIHLIVTSPPYWTLKEYPVEDGQLGRLQDYDVFLNGLKAVWQNSFQALVPGGRLVCVVGDVCLSRRQNGGRHTVVPLHAAIQEQCRSIGFDNLSPIIWHKISNVQTEANRKSAYLGKPFEPNGIIKNDIEYILMFRRPGGYRSPSTSARVLSVIPAEKHNAWFRQIWNGPGGALTKHHPAPFPVELAERLVRMFSFAGDTVFDPFTGTATTQVAASKWGRDSIGIDIEPSYLDIAEKRLIDQPNTTVDRG